MVDFKQLFPLPRAKSTAPVQPAPIAHVRTAFLPDVPEIVQLDGELNPAHCCRHPGWKDRLASGLVLVAEYNHAVIGFLAAYDRGCDTELTTFGVATRWQRRGVGVLLMNQFVEAIHIEGLPHVVNVRVPERAEAAWRFLVAMGFRGVTVKPGYFADQDAYVMTRDLPWILTPEMVP